MFRIFISLLLFFSFTNVLRAQEINCTVQVVAPLVQNIDKQIFETLQKSIMEFMNDRKWTNDQFLPQEKIECSFLITINEASSSNDFSGTIQVQSRRPVFKSSYNSTMINFLDESFAFRYLEFESLDFNEQTYTSSLTSAMALYAYVFIGIDYESFKEGAGQPYYQKAMNIINNSQSSAKEKGWKAFEATRNRYWLVENLLNPQLKEMSNVYYKYHRQGLDVMWDNVAGGREQILESLKLLKEIHQQKPGSLIMQTFFAAKADELVNIFSEANPEEKASAYTMLIEIDAGNFGKYQKLQK